MIGVTNGRIGRKPYSSTITLLASSWDTSTMKQTVSVRNISSVETDQLIVPTPATSSQQTYHEYGIKCTNQSSGMLEFTATSIPTTDLTVYVAIIPLN